MNKEDVWSILYDFPENLQLVKDSGLFELYSENGEELLMRQGVDEPIDYFINRIKNKYNKDLEVF